ncbi:MAG: 3-hydroxyacyl-CoA dehydrogenase NAD-binding domain-containing protein [Candidatus Bathyarchaeia archaeon]
MGSGEVACVGAGLIGHSWATLFAWRGYKVKLYDSKVEALKSAIERIRGNLEFLAGNGLLDPKICGEALARIRVTGDLGEAVGEAEYVQESVYESYRVKKKIFEEMDKVAPAETILASSSSTLKMTLIQRVVRRPGRCVVAHPWNPPHLMPLVEIIPGRETKPETVEAARTLMTNLGKVAVIQRREVSGTIGNRLAAALWREAIDLVYKGVADLEDVDKAASAGPGIRWAILGPHLSYHLGGGEGGIEYYLKHLGPAMASRWRSMAKWTEIPPKAERKIIQGIKDMRLLREKSIEEVARWRDEKLIELLKILYWKDPQRSSMLG